MKVKTSKMTFRMPHLDSKNHVTLPELFKMYPYKDIDTSIVQGRNYIKKEDLVPNHKYSLTLKQWKEIITACCEVVVEEMIEGHKVTLPYSFGEMYILKYKTYKPKWFHDYSFTDDWKLGVKWKQSAKTVIGWATRFFWSQKSKKAIIKAVNKNKFLVNNYFTI